MHRNYRVHSPIQTIRYTNRLEIRDPGYSLKPEDYLGEPDSLEPRGKTSGAYYLPTPLLLEGFNGSMGVSAISSDTTLQQGAPPAISLLSQEVPPVISSLPQEPASVISLLPQELSVKVQELSQRKAPDEVKAVIVDLCSWKALKASELATVLDRDQAYITRNYLTPLIDARPV